MPVRTRSQRAREESGINDNNASRKTIKKRRSTRWKVNTLNKNEEMEAKSEEVGNDEVIEYRSNVDEFRKYVKNILDSPNKIDLPTHNKVPMASPRLERITIKQANNKNMEFLIPPRSQQEDAIEIREKIRAALNNNDKPETFKPVNDNTQIANNYGVTPVANKQQKVQEQISKWLIILIFSILTGVFIAFYHNEISNFVKSQLNQFS
eukprot:381954_1